MSFFTPSEIYNLTQTADTLKHAARWSMNSDDNYVTTCMSPEHAMLLAKALDLVVHVYDTTERKA